MTLEKEGSVGVVGLEDADASMDGITSLNAVLNKSAISDVCSDLEIDEQDDELALLNSLTLPLHAFLNCGSIK